MKATGQHPAADDLFAFGENQAALQAETERLKSRIQAQIDACFDADRITREDVRGAILDKRALGSEQNRANFERRIGAYTILQHLVLQCEQAHLAPTNLRIARKMLTSPESPLPHAQTVDNRC